MTQTLTPGYMSTENERAYYIGRRFICTFGKREPMGALLELRPLRIALYIDGEINFESLISIVLFDI